MGTTFAWTKAVGAAAAAEVWPGAADAAASRRRPAKARERMKKPPGLTLRVRRERPEVPIRMRVWLVRGLRSDVPEHRRHARVILDRDVARLRVDAGLGRERHLALARLGALL